MEKPKTKDYLFFAHRTRLQLIDGEVFAKFDDNLFATKDEAIAKKIREHPLYKAGKIVEGGVLPGKRQKPDIIRGTRASVLSEEDLQAKFKRTLAKKYERYGELKARLLKNDGKYRKDAAESDINEYEKLREELR